MSIRTESNIFAIIGLLVFSGMAWVINHFWGWSFEGILIGAALYTALRIDAEVYLKSRR